MIRVQSFVADFWKDGCETMTRNVCALLRLAREPVTYQNMVRAVRSMPRDVDQAYDVKWMDLVYWGQCFQKIDHSVPEKAKLGDYFLDVARLSLAARQMLEESIIGVLQGLNSDLPCDVPVVAHPDNSSSP
jgi:hypothetical protein